MAYVCLSQHRVYKVSAINNDRWAFGVKTETRVDAVWFLSLGFTKLQRCMWAVSVGTVSLNWVLRQKICFCLANRKMFYENANSANGEWKEESDFSFRFNYR